MSCLSELILCSFVFFASSIDKIAQKIFIVRGCHPLDKFLLKQPLYLKQQDISFILDIKTTNRQIHGFCHKSLVFEVMSEV